MPSRRGGTTQDQPRAGVAPIRRVCVVVPARDEAATLGACLRRIARAAHRLAIHRPQIQTQLVVVADRCTDATAEIAASHGAWVLPVDAGQVGRSRHLGATAALGAAQRRGIDPQRCWLASTDADTLVPSSWLLRQMELADLGYDALVGTVVPTNLPRPILEAWFSRHTLTEHHPHVHGANLGVRGSAYAAVGGFAPVATHEDADLVARLRAAGLPVLATDTFRVSTSGRLQSRAPAGFAAYLAALVEQAGSGAVSVTDPGPDAAGPALT